MGRRKPGRSSVHGNVAEQRSEAAVVRLQGRVRLGRRAATSLDHLAVGHAAAESPPLDGRSTIFNC